MKNWWLENACSKKKFEIDDYVLILTGQYQGFQGKVTQKYSNGCVVQIIIGFSMMYANYGLDELEKIEWH